jgi:hypothetical protein
MSDYQAFLSGKAVAAPELGLREVPALAKHLFPFQAACVEFGLRQGSWGCYLATGLGKSACELEWSRHASEASNGRALILTPLAVARQMEREGQRWGYDVRVIRQQSDVRDGISVCNYDRLDKLDPDAFGSVAFDESSIVKAWNGKTSRALFRAFGRHRWRMAPSATPAPNDHIELGQQSELLGVMPLSDMLVRWFINDTADTGTWRLKGHAVRAFWDWMATWARVADHPRDLGDDVAGYDLPPLNVIRHRSEGAAAALPGEMFAGLVMSATGMHDVKRQTARARAELAAEIVSREPAEAWLVWVDTDYEADAVAACLPSAVEVRGSHPIERKETSIAAFADGSARVLLTKPSVAGWGLNFQHCARMLFVGRSFSFEMWHQAVRRCWRFGQARPVDCHLIVADGEDAIGRVIDRKQEDHDRMKREMVAAMRRAIGSSARHRTAYEPTHEGHLPAWLRSAS